MSSEPRYRLFTDATADLPAETVERLDIDVIPMEFVVNDETYLHYPDARELSLRDFYGMLREGAVSKTVQINIARYIECFEPVLRAGTDLLYICFSSALSGTYQTCLIAAAELREKYPERRIEIVDSKCASVGEGVLVYGAAVRRLRGMSFDRLRAWVEENKGFAAHQFVVDDLAHLRRGGRIGSVASIIGTALAIKPYLRVDENGALYVHSKIRGRKGAVDALVAAFRTNYNPARESTFFVAHTDAPEAAEELARRIRAECDPVGDVIVTEMGPIIGSHVGAGTLALAFLGHER